MLLARRVYSACNGVCSNQCAITACARGPAWPSSASHAAVPAGVPASSAARQRSRAVSSTPIGSNTIVPIGPPVRGVRLATGDAGRRLAAA